MTNQVKKSRLLVAKANITNKTNWLCFFAGFFLVFSYAPFSLWWLALCLPSIALYQLHKQPPKKSAKYMLCFALGWFSSGISWVHVSIDQFGGLPLAVSLLLMLLLCLYLALYPTLAAYLSARLSSNKQLNLWLLPPLWLFCEYLRSVVLTGFPWLSLGYSQIDSPLNVFAPVIGEVGITALILLINVTLALSAYKLKQHLAQNKVGENQLNPSTSTALLKPIITPLIVLSVLTLTTTLLTNIQWISPSGKTTSIALVQGNIAQAIKWKPEQEWPTMLKYLDLTRANYDADIIVWPESAIPTLEPAAQDYLATVNSSALLNNSAIITGLLNYNFESKKYFNGIVVLGKKNEDDEQGYYYNHSNRYYKHHLLPIGEFVPFEDFLRPIAPLFNLAMSSFSSGDYVQANIMAKGLSILPLNCFEVAFPHQLSANLTAKTDIILTVSNDAWFGKSHGPHQHFEIARMRALEFGRPLVRSTNNGITGTVNHLGEVTAVLPQFEEAVLKTTVALVKGATPYSKAPQLILWLLIVFMLISAKAVEKRVK
ncbi:apolipoprotein N-acyltransferase [Colwellia sp. D2M02]|uniref:apolipoprotein N-acyltransferase n=1 Tax=Colwellia sp. D2M02 TaxID=2841562 RepID=UPI001C086E86|nr:apolipoprotein N-acyltransferase [Colwellia sp. D2M02]